MIALYAAMILPMLTWAILDRLVEPPAGVDAVRLQLAIVLSIGIVALAALLYYVDRTVIRPLEERALRFAACLSHELRTPLMAVRGAAELLEDPTLDPSTRTRFAHNIIMESDRLGRLVTGVLDLERADHGAIHRDEPSALREVLSTLAERSAPLLARKDLRLIVRDTSEATVVASADRLHRILMGLLENAIRHAPRGGTIHIAATQEGALVNLTVDDDGPGVPAADRGRIFSRRYSTDRGHGLGLAIVEGLIRGVGATIEVHEAPRGGARFLIRVPAFTQTTAQDVAVRLRSSARPARAS